MNRERRGVAAARYVVLVILAVLFLLPFYVLLRNALATSQELAAARWVWIPANPSLDSLRTLFANENVQLAAACSTRSWWRWCRPPAPSSSRPWPPTGWPASRAGGADRCWCSPCSP